MPLGGLGKAVGGFRPLSATWVADSPRKAAQWRLEWRGEGLGWRGWTWESEAGALCRRGKSVRGRRGPWVYGGDPLETRVGLTTTTTTFSGFCESIRSTVTWGLLEGEGDPFEPELAVSPPPITPPPWSNLLICLVITLDTNASGKGNRGDIGGHWVARGDIGPHW